MSGTFVKIKSEEASWSTGLTSKAATPAIVPRSRAATSPCPGRFCSRTCARKCLLMEQMGVPVEVHHHEVAGAGQLEIGTKFSTLVQRADWTQITKYIIHNVAHAYGKTATHAQAHRRRQRFGHARAPVHLEGRPEPVRGQRLRRPVGLRVLHRRHHQARPRAERHHQPAPTRTSAWFRTTKPRSLAYSARNRSASIRIPYVGNPKGRRVEARFPDPWPTRTWPSRP